MRQWKYFLNGERIGPIGEDQLVRKLLANELPRTITVWTEGMFVWKRVDETPLVKKLATPASASVPATSGPTPSPVMEAPCQPLAKDPPVITASPSPFSFMPVASPLPETPVTPAASATVPENVPPSFITPSIPEVPPAPTGPPPQPIVLEPAQAIPPAGVPEPSDPTIMPTEYSPLTPPPAPSGPVAQFSATADPLPPSSGTRLLGSTTPYVEVRPPAPKQFELSLPLRILASIVGFGVGYYVIWELPPKIAMGIGVGSLAGIACGLLPFFLAKQRNNLRLGRMAVGVCWLSGAAFGLLLAIPVAVIFTVVVLTGKNRDTGY
jgi:hypothetical protein